MVFTRIVTINLCQLINRVVATTSLFSVHLEFKFI